MKDFGKRVEKLRNKYNHTRDELAEYCKVTSKVIYNIEKGISEPNISTLIAISRRYNVSLDYLLFGKENE